jgi:hypothetical protein
MAAALPLLGSVAGGASKIGKELLGSASSFDSNQNVQSNLQLRPEDAAAINAQRQRAQASGQGLSSLAQELQTQSLAGAPQLGAISQPSFGGQLDQLSQGLVAQGQQQLGQAAAAQQQAIANQFRQQPGVARALSAQSANRAVLQQNPALFQAAQQQRAREGDEARVRLATEQASNQALLQQQAANQGARQEGFGFGQAGFGTESNLLNQASQLGQLLGSRQTSTQSQGGGRSGGLFRK